jgi:pilus assembly protein CpaF
VTNERDGRGAPPEYQSLPGFEPIRGLLADPAVSEIMINGPRRVFVERKGRMRPTDVTFADERQLRMLIETILRPTGRIADAQTPYTDCRLPDGSRVNIILPPLALDGPTVTIRKFSRTLMEVEDLVRIGTMTEPMATLLGAAVQARLNILFSGGTGTGKTTTLGILATRIPEAERVIVIEDTAELVLRQPHVVRLECRRANVEGTGEVTLEHLLKNSLRMRPSRILLGEIRGSEAIELLQAISSGHQGCLAVLHGSSPDDAISRLELMTLSRGLRLPLWAIYRQIAGAIDLILQHEVLLDGRRVITHVTEVVRAEEDHFVLQDLFRFDNRGPDESGKVLGEVECTGVQPTFLERLERAGVQLPDDLFDQR